MELLWEDVIPLEDRKLIDAYEEKTGFRFPESFRACVCAHNAGSPQKPVFGPKDRVFHRLYSFNQDDKSSIWKQNDWNGRQRDWNTDGQAEPYIAFGDTCFGDWVCFDRRDGKIVLFDHDTCAVETEAENFDEFINSLRPLPD